MSRKIHVNLLQGQESSHSGERHLFKQGANRRHIAERDGSESSGSESSGSESSGPGDSGIATRNLDDGKNKNIYQRETKAVILNLGNRDHSVKVVVRQYLGNYFRFR